jgi:hypothetical protein
MTMTAKEFNTLFIGGFVPDERLIAIDNQLSDYYKAAESAGIRGADRMWYKFKLWCFINGYSQKEVNESKQRLCRNS